MSGSDIMLPSPARFFSHVNCHRLCAALSKVYNEDSSQVSQIVLVRAVHKLPRYINRLMVLIHAGNGHLDRCCDFHLSLTSRVSHKNINITINSRCWLIIAEESMQIYLVRFPPLHLLGWNILVLS